MGSLIQEGEKINTDLSFKVVEAPSRSAYIIDTDGTVQNIIEEIDTENHVEQL